MSLRVASKMSSARSEKSSASSRNISSKRTTFKTKNLLRKRNDLTIVYNDEDATPKLLPPIDVSAKHEMLSLTQLEARSHYEFSVFGNTSASVLHTNMHSQSIAAASQHSYTTIINKDDLLESDSESIFDERSSFESTPSGTWTPPKIMPKYINIVLAETPVQYLLEITSSTEVKGTDEGDIVEKDNEVYDFLTIGKGRNRKTTNAEIQTALNLLKSRSTNAKRPRHTNDYAFASFWDMYDTYEAAPKSDGKLIKEEKSVKVEKLKAPIDSHLKLDEETETSTQDKLMEELLKNPKFQKSVLVMERVLANNVFNQQQKRFRGLIEQDPFRPDIEFKYKLEYLWTFQTAMVENHPVTTMQWHPYNSDILAVGYGKFYYIDAKPGLVYCWNVKNPKQPEREYRYMHPVTSLAFSQYEPNLLAVGLYDGTVSILDICQKNVEQLMVTKRHPNSSYEPIWQIEWFAPDGYNINDNHVICVCQDGRVCSFIATKTNDLLQIEMMKVFRPAGTLKGVYKPKQCAASEVPISSTAAALTITKHPVDESIYFVGTSEGTVHKCSENYQDRDLDVLITHAGPVYGLQYSHFCPKVYLTCGADSYINIWVEDMKEPIARLAKDLQPVEGAEWCPANSTIIANVSGNSIYLWDLQRKTYLPASEHTNPTKCRNTTVKFSPSGKNIVVGDIEGNVHVFALADIPFPPFYQAEMLEQVLYKNLITRPDLVQTIKKVGLCYKTGEAAIF